MTCTGSANPRDGSHQGEKKACCTPSAGPRGIETDQMSDIRTNDDVMRRMVRLEGGAFLMGTYYSDAFVDDGEGLSGKSN